MESRAHALAAGLFAIVLGTGLVFAIWWFSEAHAPMRELVLVARGDINGLGAQSRVRYRGLAVGSVHSIRVDPDDLRNLLVHVQVPAELPITRGTSASLGTLGVTGLAFVQLDDRGEDPAPLVGEDGAPPRIVLEPGLVAAIAGRALAALDQFAALGERLARLVDDDNLARLSATLAHLESATAGMDRGMAELPATLAALRAAFSADNLRRLSAVLANLEHGSAQAGPALAELRHLIARVDAATVKLEQGAGVAGEALIEHTLPQLDGVLGELGSTARRLARLIDDLDSAPQLLLTGRARREPGPGEPGFDGLPGDGR